MPLPPPDISVRVVAAGIAALVRLRSVPDGDAASAWAALRELLESLDLAAVADEYERAAGIGGAGEADARTP